jgi:uncharacterized protein (UPF0335 family)
VSSVEEMLRQALERVERLEELSEVMRRRYRSLKRRNQLALEKLKDVVAELEAVDYDNPHVETALELLYDIERLLEVAEDE